MRQATKICARDLNDISMTSYNIMLAVMACKAKRLLNWGKRNALLLDPFLVYK